MQGLLRWLAASPMRAGIAAAALVVSRLLDVFAGALLAMQTLQGGARAGLQLAAVAMPLVLLAGLATGTGPLLLMQAGLLWLPVFAMSLVLRHTQSQALMMQAGALLVALAATGWYLAVPDPAGQTGEFLEQVFLPVMRELGTLRQEPDGAAVEGLARLLPAFISGGSLVAMIVVVLLGRFWQATAWNPRGFGREFRELRHGRSFALAAGLLVLAVSWSGHMLAAVFAMAAGLVLLFQGVAVVHALAANRRIGAGWLWVMYAALLLLPVPASTLLVLGGGADNWLEFRRRFPPENAGN